MLKKDFDKIYVVSKKLKDMMKEYEVYKKSNISLNMARGKPCVDQTELSDGMFDVLTGHSDFYVEENVDCRNYGMLDGIPSMKKLFSDLIAVKPENIFVGGNSSLNMMFDIFSHCVTHGIAGEKPWFGRDVKFLCPVPGYDRHFAITEYYNIKMINIQMNDDGPDMDTVERLVSEDEDIKGIWCVPKYSNPGGNSYSDDVVRRFANLKPKAKDFRIFWDNAYCIHDIVDSGGDILLSLMDECIKSGNEDLPIIFASTSKITFPGSGVAAMAASDNNMKEFRKRYSVQTIGYDKLNQLRHARFFENKVAIKDHMREHTKILRPKFDIVLDKLEKEFSDKYLLNWSDPKGGYFVSIDLLRGSAKRTVELCKNVGLILTEAGATYPYGVDPNDSNIRIAPTYPSEEELKKAVDILCLCINISSAEKFLSENTVN